MAWNVIIEKWAMISWNVLLSTRNVQTRSSSCECFPGIAGALAGFGALGALIAYAVYQAIQATTTTTAAPAAAANNGGARSTAAGPGSMDKMGFELAMDMLSVLLNPEQDCAPAHLCRLNAKAQNTGYPYNYFVRIGSLPLAWLKSDVTHSENGVTLASSIPELCAAATEATPTQKRCQSLYPHCPSS